MRIVRPKRRLALVALCRRCDGDPKALRRALKAEFAARGSGKRVRVVLTTCLDICPKRAIALAVAPETGAPQYLVANGTGDAAAIAASVLAGEPPRRAVHSVA